MTTLKLWTGQKVLRIGVGFWAVAALESEPA